MQWWSCSCLTLVLMLIITCTESSLLLFFIPACATCCVSLTLHHLSLGSPPPLLNEEACAVYVCLALVCAWERNMWVHPTAPWRERVAMYVSLSAGVWNNIHRCWLSLRCASHWGAKYTCAAPPTHRRSNSRFQIYLYPCDHSERDCCEIHTSYHGTSLWRVCFMLVLSLTPGVN